MGIYPDVFSTPEPLISGGSDYGWLEPGCFSGFGYMGGLESSQVSGAVANEYQQRVFDTTSLDRYHRTRNSTTLPHNFFFSHNGHGVHEAHSTIPMGTPIYGYADVNAQAPDFCRGLNLHLDPTLATPTSTMPNSMTLLAPSRPPFTPIEPITTTGSPTTIADYGYNHEHDHSYGYGHATDLGTPATDLGTPATDLSEQETSTSAKKTRNRKPEGDRVYRISYNHRDSHRYVCDPCRFSTDVKRDFDRHKRTDKHKKRHLQQGGQREGPREGRREEPNEEWDVARRMR